MSYFRRAVLVGAALLCVISVGLAPAGAATAAPTISALTPVSGPVGTRVIIQGTGFSGATAVAFNGVTTSKFHIGSDRQVGATVPAAATTGPVSVTTPHGTAISRSKFTVVRTPVVSLSRTSGPPTSQLTASGTGFVPGTRVNLFFDSSYQTLAATDSSGSFSGVAVSVPSTATPGGHWVTASQQGGRVAAQAPFTVATEWAQFHFSNDQRGENPYENVLSPGAVPGLSLAWSTANGSAVQGSPSVVDGVVYVAELNGLVQAYSATTGALQWSYQGNGGYYWTPDVVGGLVYVASSSGYLTALSASDGAVIWTFVAGSALLGGPTVTNGVAYVATYGGTLYVVNATTGTQEWSATAGPVYGGSPAVAGGSVFLDTGDGTIYAYNASTGTLEWSYKMVSALFASPAVADGVVYVADDGQMYALSAADGTVLWTYETPDLGGFQGSAAVADGLVFAGSYDDKVYGLNASTGSLVWSFTTGGVVTSSAAVADGVVYVGSDDDSIYALDATSGSLLWSYRTGGEVQASPSVTNGTLYEGSNDSNLYAFSVPGTMNAVARPAPGTLAVPG